MTMSPIDEHAIDRNIALGEARFLPANLKIRTSISKIWIVLDERFRKEAVNRGRSRSRKISITAWRAIAPKSARSG